MDGRGHARTANTRAGDDEQLQRLQQRYQAVTEQIGRLGFIASGSVVERLTTCTAAGCRCHRDPPQRHGPYLQYTRKIAGKTVTTRLTVEHAEHYREQIANRRRLDELIATMLDISAQARRILLAQPLTEHSDATT